MVDLEEGLSFDEEIVVKNLNGIVHKVKIGTLGNSWNKLRILSIIKDGRRFGSPIFLPIKNFSKNESSFLLKIRLADGRQIICSPNLRFPTLKIQVRVKTDNSPKNIYCVDYVNAQQLKSSDNLLVLHKIPFSSNLPKYIFIPNLLDWENRWIGIKRDDYIRFSYRINQNTNDPLIQLINSKFYYSKSAKKYLILWSYLTNSEKKLIEKEAIKQRVKILIKIHERVGFWYPSIIPLSNNFFKYLGWYVAEGASDDNRITLTQSRIKNYSNWKEIIKLLEDLNFPVTTDGKKSIRINSNVLKELTIKICSYLAQYKKIPFNMVSNSNRVNSFLETYYKGDGCQLREGLRKFTTASQQLKNDLVCILGAIGKFCSIWHPNSSDNCFRITETDGKLYRRKYMGFLNFNGTTPSKVKLIEKIKNNSNYIFNINTKNGLFVSTNGIIVHQSSNC